MRWLACCVLLAGCLRARATMVHPTSHEGEGGGLGGTAIARTAPVENEVSQPADGKPNPNLGSLELGALIPFDVETARVHLAPGVRIFDSHPGAVLFGVAVGADFLGRHGGPGFALEGSVHAGNSSQDRTVVVQAVDVFGGVTLSNRTPMSFAIGPSLGMLGMPGGHSVVTLGLGLRVTSHAKN